MDINETQPGEIGIFYSMIASGPVIIQTRDGLEKTLLVKHGDKPIEQLKWKFCGGKIIRGLTLEENAIREAKEEIGLTVELIKPLIPLILWNEIPEAGHDNPEAILLIHYLAKINDEPKRGQQILAMEWFDVDNLPNDCAPNIKAVIDNYKQQK